MPSHLSAFAALGTESGFGVYGPLRSVLNPAIGQHIMVFVG